MQLIQTDAIRPLEEFFARRLLKDQYTEERANFLRTLMRKSREGHICWETDEVPDLPDSLIQEGTPTAPIIKDGNRYYLNRNWVYETYLINQVNRLHSLKLPPLHDSEIFYRKLNESPLQPLQKKVVESVLQRPFSLICGGPGTGKTYTAGMLVKLLIASKLKEKYKVVLAAPTGKAASHLQMVLNSIWTPTFDPFNRLSNGMGIEATTLHRLLRVVPGENQLFSNRTIDADLIIVDEASMIDLPLFAQLLGSIGNETRLVLMGDPDQLPPVEAGSLFAEMAALFAIPLKNSMRTNQQTLQILAEGINRGEWIGDDHLLNWPFDSTLAQKLFEVLQPNLSWDEPNPSQSLDALNRFRILGALRQGPFGIEKLNEQMIHEMSLRIRPGQWWVIPIMITSNEPLQNLYNGTCGVLIGKSRGGIHLRDGIAYFPEKIPFRDLPPFEVAFCLSIHKSQGSEFERIVALFPEGSEHFGREAVYTAVTRAKKGVQIVGDREVLKLMLSRRSQKTSGFKQRMGLGAFEIE